MSYLSGPRPLSIAHRGGALLWPENTLVAFREATALGYTHFETDVHLTRDGALVIFHDETLERTTEGQGRVADHTLTELRALDAGHWFSADGRTYPHRGRDVRIPTLEEALTAFPQARFTLEIKPEDNSVARPLWDMIEAHRAHDRVLVASAHTTAVNAFRKIARGRVVTSASKEEIFRFWLAARAHVSRFLAVRYEALQVPIRRGVLRIVDERFLRAAHRAGLHVHVWTINDRATMTHLRDLGVDGIMTDRPDLLPVSRDG